MIVRRLNAVLVTVAFALALAGPAAAQGPTDPLQPLTDRGDRYVPKPVGTEESLTLWYGPYVVPPGHDANRVDVELPIRDTQLISIEPGMRSVIDLSEPSHQVGHIHHAHWFGLDPGNKQDNHFNPQGYNENLPDMGMAEWTFGNGDEETKADFTERSGADPSGPVYGPFVGKTPQAMIFMLHNKTAQPLPVYIALDVTIIHGTKAELDAWDPTRRPHRDVTGVLFGRTFTVPRQADGDGRYEYRRDTGKEVEWTSTVDGTIIGMGGHVHPGGIELIAENFGSVAEPCPKTGDAYDGTELFKSKALFRTVPLSEDYQMEVTNPGFRAPIHIGDRLRISATYENKDHGWVDVMEHMGIYIDEEQPPVGHCAPTILGHPEADPTVGVANRAWGVHSHDTYCGPAEGSTGPCDRPEKPYNPGLETDTVHIANFSYLPGDINTSGQLGDPPRIKQGTSLRFVNEDFGADIRHSVTTCAWPCNGPYVGNYPLHDGVFESKTLGYDAIDGGEPNPVAQTPTDLKPGKYAYYCRIHPFMRGAFEVVPAAAATATGGVRRLSIG